MVSYLDLVSDTICAPITAPGPSGVALVRVSGDRSLEWTQRVCPFLPEDVEDHRIYLGSLQTLGGEKTLDQVLVSYFKKGHSFTGDEVVEISSHGNPLVVQKIISQYLAQGCRQAERGEFSFRAFYNGKIDLIQAESIQGFVASQSLESSQEFLKQLKGGLSSQFTDMEDQLLLAISHLEARIDFVEQDIDPVGKTQRPTDSFQRETPREDEVESQRGEVLGVEQEILKNVLTQTQKLMATYPMGQDVLEGFKVLVLGKSNVGKSSLFNLLCGKDRSIVTHIPGTTRDLVSGSTFLNSSRVEFLDSAGIRKSQDPVEQIGIQKALDQIQNSHLLLLVLEVKSEGELDLSTDVGLHRNGGVGVDAAGFFEVPKVLQFPLEKTCFIFNKIDLLKPPPSPGPLSQSLNSPLPQGIQLLYDRVKKQFPKLSPNQCFLVSAKEEKGIEELESFLGEKTQKPLGDNQVLLTQSRHLNHLKKMEGFLIQALHLLHGGGSEDLISQELQQSLEELHKILGRSYDDQILDRIFKEFCIGK